MVRCFIAIFLPDSIKNKIVGVQNLIETLGIDCKLVEYENLHITLSFIGEVNVGAVEALKAKLDGVCNGFENFNVGLDGVKFIPNEHHVRVIAICVNRGGDILHDISKEIESTIGGDAKPPHLTLCRVRGIDKKSVITRLLQANVDIGEFPIESVQLAESQISRSGPIYNILHNSRLR